MPLEQEAPYVAQPVGHDTPSPSAGSPPSPPLNRSPSWTDERGREPTAHVRAEAQGRAQSDTTPYAAGRAATSSTPAGHWPATTPHAPRDTSADATADEASTTTATALREERPAPTLAADTTATTETHPARPAGPGLPAIPCGPRRSAAGPGPHPPGVPPAVPQPGRRWIPRPPPAPCPDHASTPRTVRRTGHRGSAAGYGAAPGAGSALPLTRERLQRVVVSMSSATTS
jgi:hypothetical protein